MDIAVARHAPPHSSSNRTDETIAIGIFDLRSNETEFLAGHASQFAGSDGDAKRRSYVQWLLENPVPGSLYLAAYVNGQFASFLAFLARRLVGFGGEYRGALAAAAFTLPEFGGRGLYRRLAAVGWERAARGGFDVALGYTIRRYVLELELRMGWSAASVAPIMALPLAMPAVLNAALPGLGRFANFARPADLILERLTRRLARRAADTRYVIDYTDEFSHEFDALSKRLTTAELLHFAKDRATLQWLYRSPANPFIYDIVTARRDGELVGFAVGRPMDLLGLDGYAILDLVAAPGETPALAPLAAALVLRALPQKPQVIGALTSSGHPAQQTLRRLGFVNSRKSFTLISRPLQNDLPPYFFVSGNWCNFWGNNDTV